MLHSTERRWASDDCLAHQLRKCRYLVDPTLYYLVASADVSRVGEAPAALPGWPMCHPTMFACRVPNPAGCEVLRWAAISGGLP